MAAVASAGDSQTADTRRRTQLIERHLDIPVRAAKMIYPRVKDHVPFEELVSLGNAGLTEAAQRYQDDRGATFSTFAWYRVQGAIIDGLRKMTPLPRRVWHKLVALRAAADYLEHQGERAAASVKVGVAVPTGVDALAKIKESISAIRTMYLTSLEGLAERTGFDPVDPGPSPVEAIETQRMKGKVAAAIANLPVRERALLTKHYFEGKNLLEAGEELGISKSWASRMHAQAVDRLRRVVDVDDG